MPMLTRFFCPPEMPLAPTPPQIEWRCSLNPNRSTTRSTKRSTRRAHNETGRRWRAANQSCARARKER
eukprot:590581-Pleurochrysis_carterae.AAC.1